MFRARRPREAIRAEWAPSAISLRCRSEPAGAEVPKGPRRAGERQVGIPVAQLRGFVAAQAWAHVGGGVGGGCGDGAKACGADGGDVDRADARAEARLALASTAPLSPWARPRAQRSANT